MELIYTDAQWHDLAVVAGCELDCEFGPGSRNSWQLECPADDAPAMSDGSLLYCDGGEVGGVVDGIAPDTGEGTVTFSGRTWHGVLDGNLIAPAAGQDYKTVDGEANAAIGSLIGEMGISDLFAADPADSGVRVSHQFGRPAATGYQGLVDMLAGSGAKLRTRFDSALRKCVLSAAPKGDYSTEELDGDRISVKIERDWRPVNHLACFGSGELKDRIRLDLYADESGNVSKTQSIFGAKHRGAVYDYSSADAETLEKDGRKKLEELQAADEIQVTLPDDSEYEIGDVVGGREPVTGIYTTATLTRKTVLIDGGGETDVRYEAGGTASGVSLSNASGGGNGGHAYLAGKGLTLSNYTFSAEVDAESLAAVEAKADGAATAASNASAAAGKAEAVANAATVAAAENAKAIAGKQDKLTAGENVTIDGATISAKDTTYTEATTSKAGLMSALDKKKLDNKVDDTASGVSAALEKLPTWVANPTDSTQLVRRDTNGTAEYGRVTFRTVWNYIKGKADAVYAAVSHTHPYLPLSGGTLTGNVTAPKFVGGLQGTADAAKTADMATTASRVAAAGASAYNAARHVWFSDKSVETARVYNDAFRYNPVGNMLSCNVSGSAATADSAASAAKLAKSRTVSISGAVNGSATWDGSGDLEIVVAGDSVAAGFLAAHPVGFYVETSGADPNNYGGTWERAPSVGPYTWLRTK